MTMAHVRAQADTWDELVDSDGSPRPAAAALLAQLVVAAVLQQAGPVPELR